MIIFLLLSRENICSTKEARARGLTLVLESSVLGTVEVSILEIIIKHGDHGSVIHVSLARGS